MRQPRRHLAASVKMEFASVNNLKRLQKIKNVPHHPSLPLVIFLLKKVVYFGLAEKSRRFFGYWLSNKKSSLRPWLQRFFSYNLNQIQDNKAVEDKKVQIDLTNDQKIQIAKQMIRKVTWTIWTSTIYGIWQWKKLTRFIFLFWLPNISLFLIKDLLLFGRWRFWWKKRQKID